MYDMHSFPHHLWDSVRGAFFLFFFLAWFPRKAYFTIIYDGILWENTVFTTWWLLILTLLQWLIYTVVLIFVIFFSLTHTLQIRLQQSCLLRFLLLPLLCWIFINWSTDDESAVSSSISWIFVYWVQLNIRARLGLPITTCCWT